MCWQTHMMLEINLFREVIPISEDDAWKAIGEAFDIFSHGEMAYAVAHHNFGKHHDLREIIESSLTYDGIAVDIHFAHEKNRIILFGVTNIGSGPFSRYEHICGYFEVSPKTLYSTQPVEICVACCWRPLYLLFHEVANFLRARFTEQPFDNALRELVRFKSEFERQGHRDLFVGGKPRENFGRSMLQFYLKSRSYREVTVRGGKSDILAIDHESNRYIYEVKIWRGKTYHEQGIREMEEYIKGENTDDLLRAGFYVIFDATSKSAAHTYLGSDIMHVRLQNVPVGIIVIHAKLVTPSKYS